jgi:hypothetical protein
VELPPKKPISRSQPRADAIQDRTFSDMLTLLVENEHIPTVQIHRVGGTEAGYCKVKSITECRFKREDAELTHIHHQQQSLSGNSSLQESMGEKREWRERRARAKAEGMRRGMS